VGAEVTDITPVYPAFRYREIDSSGIVEHEVCPVFAAQITNEIMLNRDEVMEYRWLSLNALRQAIEAAPFLFSPWMERQFAHAPARDALFQFARAV
jgi:isopentenyl-diphosphate delta-isomerase